MAKRKFDLDVESDRLLALQYFDELDSDDAAYSSEGDNASVASEEEDSVEYIQEVDDFFPIDEDNQCSAGSDSDDEPLANLRAKYLNNPSYISKNQTFWNQDPPIGRRSQQNIVRIPSGLTAVSENFSDLDSCFKLFICEAMVEKIVQFTNQKALSVYEKRNREYTNKTKKTWMPVDITEMYAVIGLLITAGALKAKREPIQFLWCKNPLYCRPIFTATMSRTRFSEILSYMRFDDLTTRTARKQHDKLAAIRDIFEMFVEHCKENYTPGFHLTVDEQLVSFRGNCPFRVYMKSKPAKYGIKIWAMVDCEITYAWNLQIYSGKQGNAPEKEQGKRVVLDLVQGIQRGSGITTDNFFTSVPLAKELYERGITLCGTLRKNKADIPPALLPNRNKAEKSSSFGFHKYITLVSYVNKKNNGVILLSTEHHDKNISGMENDFKPDIILHYNNTKGAVDTMDKMVNEYSVKRSTKRYPFVLFQNIIDIAGVNSYSLWTKKFPDWKEKQKDKRRLFLLDLGLALIKPHVARRMTNVNGIPKRVVDAMNQVLPQENVTIPPNPERSFGRCHYCPRSDDKKCRLYCEKCKNFFCKNHGQQKKINYCTKCNENGN